MRRGRIEAGGEELFTSIYPFLEKQSEEYYVRFAKPAWENEEDYAYFRKIYADGHWKRMK